MCGWLELEMALASRFLSSIASATLVSLLRGRQDLASRSAQWSDRNDFCVFISPNPLVSRPGSEVSIESVEAPGSQGASRAKYRVYSTEPQRSEAGCIGARMQPDFRDGALPSSWG